MNTTVLKREWFSNVQGDILAGAVVSLALIPEAIAFSIIAGVDPKVGLYASFIIAVVTAIAAIDKVVLKFRRHGADVDLVGLNEASATLISKLAIHVKPDALEKFASH